MGLRALQRRRHEVSADAAHIALFSSSLEKIILEILESPMNPAIYNTKRRRTQAWWYNSQIDYRGTNSQTGVFRQSKTA